MNYGLNIMIQSKDVASVLQDIITMMEIATPIVLQEFLKIILAILASHVRMTCT